MDPPENGLPYFIAFSVFPVDQGILEEVIVPQYNYSKSTKDLFLLVLSNYGITDKWYVYLFYAPYHILNSCQLSCDDMNCQQTSLFNTCCGETSGNGDTNLGSQYSWMYIHKSNYSAALVFDLHLPTGDINRNLTDGLMRYSPYLLLAKDFPHKKWRTQLFTQIGFEFVQRIKRHSNPDLDVPAAHYFVLNSGIAARSEKINYSLELDWFTNTWNHGGKDDQLYITPGVYAQVKKDVAIGIGFPIGLTHASYRYQIIGNLYVEIDTIFKKKTDNNESKDKKKPAAKKHPKHQKKKKKAVNGHTRNKLLRLSRQRHK